MRRIITAASSGLPRNLQVCFCLWRRDESENRELEGKSRNSAILGFFSSQKSVLIMQGSLRLRFLGCVIVRESRPVVFLCLELIGFNHRNSIVSTCVITERLPTSRTISISCLCLRAPPLYRARNKGLYMVARSFFLLLLNFSAWPCLGAA